jgi:hypothetical protein
VPENAPGFAVVTCRALDRPPSSTGAYMTPGRARTGLGIPGGGAVPSSSPLRLAGLSITRSSTSGQDPET